MNQCGLPTSDESARILLDILVSHHPALLARAEVARLVGIPTSGLRCDPRVVVDDGLTELLAAGLAHQLGDFIFASQSAMQAHVLLPD